MKIIMLGHKRIPSREGGVEIVVEELASRMAAKGHDVTVYNRKGNHVSGAENGLMEYKKSYEYRGIHVKTVFTLPNKSLNAIVYAFFATLKACVTKCDVVHFHAEGPCAMLPLAKLFGKKCVATIHGLDWQRAKWGGFATRFLLFGEKMAAKFADEVIVLSSGVQEYFRKEYDRKTLLIPNGIEKPQICEAEEITKKYGLEKEKYILFLARLVPEKGAHTLIEAYRKSNLTIPLVIAGGGSHSGDYENEIKELANEINRENETIVLKTVKTDIISDEKAVDKNSFGADGLDEGTEENSHKKIVLTGFIQGKVLEELYSNALFYVLPSEIEGMPLSLLEAMSYGNICLTSDIVENTAVTEQYGFAFQNRDVESLRAMLEKLAAKQRGFSREEIQQFILNKYNWDDVVNRTLECYESINCK